MKKYSGTKQSHAMVEHECSKCLDPVRAPADVAVVTCARCTVLSTKPPERPLTPEEKDAAKAARLQALNDARKARKAERDAVKKGKTS